MLWHQHDNCPARFAQESVHARTAGAGSDPSVHVVLPGVVDTCLVASAVFDATPHLLPKERSGVERMAGRRLAQYATARWCAHMAMTQLGHAPGAVIRGEGRQPIWPAVFCGSLTHTTNLAAAAVSTSLLSVGIDIEASGRMHAGLWPRVFTPAEREHLTALTDAKAALSATVAFSAKEAGYKAIFPVAGRYVGFHEAEVDVNWSDQTFTIRYIGEHPANEPLNTGRGYIFVNAGDGGDVSDVLTMFVIE